MFLLAKSISKKFLLITYLLFISIFGFTFNYFYGFIGFNVEDTFQHFDSGYRVLKGDIPIKDYWVADSGPLIDVFQALFFKLFGVNWSAYVIHASFFNLIFGLTVFFISNILNNQKFISMLFSICCVILMYPTSGTPQIDQQSIIISIVGIGFFIYGIKNKKNIYLSIVPFIFLLAFFTKQVPAGIFAVMLAFYSIFHFFKGNKNIFTYFIFGAAFSFFLTIIIFLIYKINFYDFYIQLIYMPLQEVSGRNWLTFDQKPFITRLVDSFFNIKYLSFLLIPTTVLYLKIKDNNKTFHFFIIYTIIITSIIHGSYTANQAVTVGLLPLISIILYSKLNNDKVLKYIFVFLILIAVSRIFLSSNNYLIIIFILLFFYLIQNKLKISNLFIVKNLLLLYTLLCTIIYFDKLIIDRKWNDIHGKNVYKDGLVSKNIDTKLNNLKWVSNWPGLDNDKILFNSTKNNLNLFKKLKINFLIITNLNFYNALLEKPNFSPVKYWWKYASYPHSNNYYKNYFDTFFKDTINSKKINLIFVLKDVEPIFEINDFKWFKNCFKKDENLSNLRRVAYVRLSYCE